MSTTSPAGHLNSQDLSYPLREQLFRQLDMAACDFQDVDAVVEYLPDCRYSETKAHACELLIRSGAKLPARPDRQWTEKYDESTKINAEAEHYVMPLCDWLPPVSGDLGSIGRRTYWSQD